MTALAVLGIIGLGAFGAGLIGAIWRWDRQPSDSGRTYALFAAAIVAATVFSIWEMVR